MDVELLKNSKPYCDAILKRLKSLDCRGLDLETHIANTQSQPIPDKSDVQDYQDVKVKTD